MRTLATLLLLATTTTVHADAPVPPTFTIEQLFDGDRGTATTTPDVGGASSGSQLVEATAGLISIRFNNAVVQHTAADAFWSVAGIAGTPSPSAHRVICDLGSARWFVSAEELTTGTPNQIYLAISGSPDATGSWKAVALPALSTTISNTHLSVDANGLYITGDTPTGGVVMALPIADLLWTGASTPSIAHLAVFATTRAGVVPAFDPRDYGAMPPPRPTAYFVARDVAPSGDTVVDLYEIQWTGTTASLIPPLAIDLGAVYPLPTRNAPQPAPAPSLNPGNGAITSAGLVRSNGYIAGIATSEIGGRLAAMWFLIGIDGSLQRTGTLFGSGDVIVPALAMFDDTIGIVATEVAIDTPPATYVTMIKLGDPGLESLVIAEAGSFSYSCAPTSGVSPFGRYSSIGIDVGASTPAFWAVAPLGAPGDCAFGSTWIHFGFAQATDSPDDPYFPGDDPGFGEFPAPVGCAGCASHDGAGSLALVPLVAALISRRRRAYGITVAQPR